MGNIKYDKLNYSKKKSKIKNSPMFFNTYEIIITQHNVIYIDYTTQFSFNSQSSN